MKPETKEWLDKVAPILAHLKEGGLVRYKDDGKLYGNTGVPYFCVLTRPDLYQIHVEPRVIYINKLDSGWLDHTHEDPVAAESARRNAERYFHGIKTIRFVEDLNWKPEPNTDKHLPDHTPPHLK